MMAVPVRGTPTALSADTPVALFKTRRVGGGVNVIGYGHQYDVAPDGRFLINVEPESEPATDHARDELETVKPLSGAIGAEIATPRLEGDGHSWACTTGSPSGPVWLSTVGLEVT